MTLKDFSPGQTVWEYDFSYSSNPIISERTVGAVGRKYVTIGKWGREQYYLNNPDDPYLTIKTIYSASSYLFPTKEALDLYIERQNLTTYIVRNIGRSVRKLPIEQLRTIKQWLEGAENV